MADLTAQFGRGRWRKLKGKARVRLRTGVIISAEWSYTGMRPMVLLRSVHLVLSAWRAQLMRNPVRRRRREGGNE